MLPFSINYVKELNTGDSQKLDEEDVMFLAKKYKLTIEEAKKLLQAQSAS